MRRGCDNGWLLDEKSGLLVGVNLGSDYCAEHEWGIKDLKALLGVPGADTKSDHRLTDYGGIYGMERRRAKSPKEGCVVLHEEGGILNLIVMEQRSLKSLLEYGLDNSRGGQREWHFYHNDEMVSAWDESSCMVRVKGEENFKKLREIHDALMRGDCCIWLGGGGVFRNAGLCIAIYDRIPEENCKTMREGDIERERLNRAAEATGIQKKIDEANKQWQQMIEVETGCPCFDRKWGYFALSPMWVSRDSRKKTKHPVMFWLNPMNQDQNNYGAFTVEELEQWLQGKGPIPMVKSKR